MNSLIKVFSLFFVLCVFVSLAACNKNKETSTDISWSGEKTYVYNDSIPFIFIKRIVFNAEAGISKAKIEKIVYKNDSSTTVDVVYEKILDGGKTSNLDSEIIFDSKSIDLSDVQKLVYSMEMKDKKNSLLSQHITILIQH